MTGVLCFLVKDLLCSGPTVLEGSEDSRVTAHLPQQRDNLTVQTTPRHPMLALTALYAFGQPKCVCPTP